MKVNDVMTREPETLAPSATCGEAATLMKQEDCGSIPIVDGGRLVGIVTDRDIVIRAVAAGKDPKTTPVSAVMSADPVTVSPDSDTEEVSRLMAERQIRRIPVVHQGRLAGIVVIGQLARREDEGALLKRISEPLSNSGSHGRG
ncbi:MAG TPA: CBS domain-containing protein [Candidatus Saccharimonadales bacterium]|nr:CBS domain-containing protein [Candidatus Saccharimonadales bacterium]